MAKKLLGLVLAILMAVPTTSFAHEDDSLKGVRSALAGARVRLVTRDGDVIRATLVRVEESSVVVSGVEAAGRPRSLKGLVVDGRETYALDAATISSSHRVIESKTEFAALAGAPDREQDATKARQVRVGSNIEVRLRDGKRVKGRVTELFADALVIRRGFGGRSIAYADMVSLDRTRMSEGNKIGAVVVGIGGAALAGFLIAYLTSGV